ncbi:MAG: DNA mismatch repair endonuclease MutL [Candidatus Binatia bacterium]
MSIQVLSPQLQQKIAAGEIIERPASVLKELIENALDAAADAIRVEIQEGGRRLIKVTDNGVGIAPTEVRLAWERFATSKIVNEHDLRAVRTFGFRGEALPSIAAVSRVRLLTRERSALLGIEARLEGGTLLSLQEAGAPTGTSVEVWDLFYNTPARRQFLRSLRTEYGHLLGVFTRFALAFPEKSFSLFFDGREVYALQPTSPQERLSACFGHEATASLEEFASTGTTGRVWGVVLPSEATWRRRFYLFVNQRSIRNRTLYRAIRDALPGEGGMVCVFVEVHPSQVDVNMHPAKAEVRFRDDVAMYELMRAALQRRTLPAWLPAERVAEKEEDFPQQTDARFSLLSQVEKTFLLLVGEGCLYVLDQHAAEERVLYEQLQKGTVQRRTLIAPQVVTVANDEREFLAAHHENVARCGFVIEPFGPHVIALREIPEFVAPTQASPIFARWLSRVRSQREDFHQALACLAAVKAGQELTLEEQKRLLTRWTQVVNPHACAHNRPTYYRLALDEVRRKVGRTGLSCEFDTPECSAKPYEQRKPD